MSSTTAAKPSKNTASEATELPLVYEVSRREKSNWIPKDKNRKKEINCAKLMVLDVRSRWYSGPAKGEVEIQYVPGAPTIFVNDYLNEKGELMPGLKKLGYDLKGEDYRRAVQEDIKFVDGYLFLENYGGRNNMTLLQYMHHHGSNEGSPNFTRKRNMNTMFLFKPMVKEKKAAAQLDTMEDDLDALKLFSALRVKKDNDFEYDTAKINAILGMLQEGQSLGDNESAAKMLIIRPFVKNKPVQFMKLYNDTMNEYGKTIALGVQLKVIDVTAKEAVIKITGMELINIPFSKEKRDENIEDMIFYFLGTEKGSILYNQIRGEVDQKKIAALSGQ